MLITNEQVPDEVYERVRKQFTESELVNLTLAGVAINRAGIGWLSAFAPFPERTRSPINKCTAERLNVRNQTFYEEPSRKYQF